MIDDDALIPDRVVAGLSITPLHAGERGMADDDNALDPDPVVAKDFGVTLKTIDNWDKARERSERTSNVAVPSSADEKQTPRFPPPVRIRNRKYRRRGDIRRFKEECAALEAGKNVGFQIVQQRPRAVRADGKRTGRFGAASDDGGDTA
jgi:hypothetical protein